MSLIVHTFVKIYMLNKNNNEETIPYRVAWWAVALLY